MIKWVYQKCNIKISYKYANLQVNSVVINNINKIAANIIFAAILIKEGNRT